MENRNINLFTEDQPNIAKKNNRDLIIGLVIFLGIVILLAKTGAGMFITLIVGLLVIFLFGFNIRTRNDEYNKQRTKKAIEDLVKRYGNYSVKIDDSCIEYMTFLFPSNNIIIIHGKKFNFSEIVDFRINDMASYKTTSSTSSIIGRGIVGGLAFGGIGALAGANTASTITTKVNTKYQFNIVIDDFSNPNFSLTYYSQDKANTLYSILKLIIDKNNSI